MALVRLERLQKSFGHQVVLDIEALDIRDGEFFSLLGPSGCGKTTTLRAIAGLVAPDGGRVLVGGRDVTDVPTWRRNLGMVFQKFALFPHLTVSENIAYGLLERGVARDDVGRRVAESLTLVALPDCGGRYPHQLSGGQQQRVALARAIVYRPDVLLLDEPLSSLDARLRVAMRVELKRVQQALGITTIFVTHDQHEALALSDRMAVMRSGRMEQIGTPEEVYETPTSAFVADFVGATNLIAGIVRGPGRSAGTVAVEIEGSGVVSVPHQMPVEAGETVRITAKPERVRLCPWTGGHDELAGEIESAAYLGSVHGYTVRLGTQRVDATCGAAVHLDGRPARAGDRIALTLDQGTTRLLRA